MNILVLPCYIRVVEVMRLMIHATITGSQKLDRFIGSMSFIGTRLRGLFPEHYFSSCVVKRSPAKYFVEDEDDKDCD